MTIKLGQATRGASLPGEGQDCVVLLGFRSIAAANAARLTGPRSPGPRWESGAGALSVRRNRRRADEAARTYDNEISREAPSGIPCMPKNGVLPFRHFEEVGAVWWHDAMVRQWLEIGVGGL